MNSERGLPFIILIIHMGMQLGKLGFLCINDASVCFWNVPLLATLLPPWFGIPFWNAPLPVSVPYEGGVSVSGCEETPRVHCWFRSPRTCRVPALFRPWRRSSDSSCSRDPLFKWRQTRNEQMCLCQMPGRGHGVGQTQL